MFPKVYTLSSSYFDFKDNLVSFNFYAPNWAPEVL